MEYLNRLEIKPTKTKTKKSFTFRTSKKDEPSPSKIDEPESAPVIQPPSVPVEQAMDNLFGNELVFKGYKHHH